MGNPLLDKDFLRELDLKRQKEIYARLTSLNFDEKPIEYIEGRVTGGSINIDGTSVVRRTCNLTLFTQDVDINEFYWGLETKIILEIGVKNDINSLYPDIIWFKQGIYVITSFNTSIGTNNATISISGKDKGCMLNGDIAGNLPSSIDFGRLETLETTYEPITLTEDKYVAYQYYLLVHHIDPILDNEGNDTGEVNEYDSYDLDTGYPDGFLENEQYYKKYITSTFTDLKLKDIIKEAVHIYAKEPYHNIIINDLEDYGLELLQYSGDKTIYLLRNVETTNFEHILLNGEKECYLAPDVNAEHFAISRFLDNASGAIQDPRVEDWAGSATQIYFKKNNNQFTDAYTVAALETGETTGYRMTDLVYNGELIANIGETLSSILDKIKNMLGDFEYFYDVDGHFIFQRKKTYINTSWNSIITSNDERFAQSMAETSSAQYSFEGNILLTAIQQSPVLNNLKNDYSIWGVRKGISGADIPIHLRYAIHKKPKYYKSFDGHVYCTNIDYAKEILEKEYIDIVANARSRVAEFEPIYNDEMPPSMLRPTKQANGLFTPGWWDIRDWAEYYKLVMNTTDDPKGTMKWYSYNTLEGCVPCASIDPSGGQARYCWLVVVTTYTNLDGSKNYHFNFQHGSGIPTGSTRPCTYYESNWVYDENLGREVLRTQKYISEETGEPITKDFIAPYSGCADQHTYLTFLNEDVTETRKVYFYNPQFPTLDQEAIDIEERIRQEYADYVAQDLIRVVDWREIIYQMALDYYQHNEEDDFLITLKNNSATVEGDYLYSDGYTGYEQYYPDMQGFWRQLYCPSYDTKHLNLRYNMKDGIYSTQIETIENTDTYIVNDHAYQAPTVESFTCDFYLSPDLKQNIDNEIANRGYGNTTAISSNYNSASAEEKLDLIGAGWTDEAAAAGYLSYFNKDYAPWARAVIDDPASLNFWIDFLDTGELGQFEVTAIGARQKVVNDNNVKCIYNKEVPDIIFVDATTDIKMVDRKTGYTYCKLNTSLENLFNISAMGKSAKELLDELLYQFSYCIENITLTSIPIYYLQPNTRIFVHDDRANIDGDYIVTKFTLPLAYNGTMSITANKAPQRIY